MKSYSKYIEDRFFVDWVYSPTQESEFYWKEYILNNPDEKNIILELKDVLLALKNNDSNLSEVEKKNILDKILTKAEDNKKNIVFKTYFKYVAVLLVMLAVSLIFKNKNIHVNETLIQDLNLTSLDSISSTQLVLNTGEQFSIDNKESKIEITKLNQVVVNLNDTISYEKGNAKTEVFNKLLVPYGKRSKITLSDGTIVHLNAGTKFIFPEKFLSKERVVVLSGEAFFEVSKDKDRPFIVKTFKENFSIEVLGTKFNLSAYPTDECIFTTLTEGSVKVLEKKFLIDKSTILKPGELATWYNNEDRVDVKTVNTDNYTLWTTGLLYFNSEPVINVIKKIERFYNVDIIVIEKEGVNHIKISGKLDLNDKIEKTLENLMFITKFKLEIK